MYTVCSCYIKLQVNNQYTSQENWLLYVTTAILYIIAIYVRILLPPYTNLLVGWMSMAITAPLQTSWFLLSTDWGGESSCNGTGILVVTNSAFDPPKIKAT